MSTTGLTLGAIVCEQPAAAALLERLGLDFCCGGSRTLEEACAERGIDAETVRMLLETPAEGAPAPAADAHDLRGASIAELCDHVVTHHHGPLRADLDRLPHHLATVVRVHGADHPELAEVERLFCELRDELRDHMGLEEARLFPACRALEEPGGAAAFDRGLLALIEDDHAATGEALASLRELCADYRPASALCATHRNLLEGLHAFELDLHQHVHEENNLLLPRVRERLAA